jgi:hypothetical protein
LFPPARSRYDHGVQTLTVEARSLKSAQGIELALVGFERKLVADDGHYVVHVTLPAGDRGIVAVLNALADHVSERGTTARINLDGQSYTLEAPPPDAPPLDA